MKILLVIFTLFLVNLVYAEQHYSPVDVEMNVQQVSEHSYYVQGKSGMATDNAGFISNSGFVVTQEGVVVIDIIFIGVSVFCIIIIRVSPSVLTR